MTEYVKMRITSTHIYFVSGPFSQWHPSPFSANLPALVSDDGVLEVQPSDRRLHFSHAEQAMMAAKASVFGDDETLAAIMAATTPKAQKELGRQVRNFDTNVWSAVAYRIVCVMNFEKFAANPDLKDRLVKTGARHLVEGAWYDRIWGVGLSWDDPAIDDKANWQGTNWLGEALMAVRAALADGSSDSDPWINPHFRTPPSR
jgi:ribA/ribD-fused uncharacterized protein